VIESSAVKGALDILRERSERSINLSKYSNFPTSEGNTDTISNATIDWTYVTIAGATALTIGTVYLVWSGSLDLNPISSGIKKVGSALLSIFKYWSDDDDGKDPGNSTSIVTTNDKVLAIDNKEPMGPTPTPVWDQFNSLPDKGKVKIPPKIEVDIPTGLSTELTEVGGGSTEIRFDPKKALGFVSSTPWLYKVKSDSLAVGPTADTNYDADSSSDDTITPSNKPSEPVVGRIIERLSPVSQEMAKDYFRDETSEEARARIDRALNQRAESKLAVNDPVSIPLPSTPTHVQEVD